MPRGTPTSNVQLSNESSITTSENTQYARLMIVAAAAPKLGKRRVSVGAASMTCIGDSVNETLANKKRSSTAAASTYGIIDSKVLRRTTRLGTPASPLRTKIEYHDHLVHAEWDVQ